MLFDQQRRVMVKANFNLGIEKSLKSVIIVLIALFKIGFANQIKVKNVGNVVPENCHDEDAIS